MTPYPVYVPGDHYAGRDPRRVAKRDRYNQVAARVQRFLNAELEKLPDDTVCAFFSHTVASEIGEDSDLVQRIIFRIEGGSGGVTTFKGDYQRAIANLGKGPR